MGYANNVAPSGSAQIRSGASKGGTPSLSPRSGVNIGNQVRLQGDSKGTGVFGRPTAIALKGKTKSLPAVENPSK